MTEFTVAPHGFLRDGRPHRVLSGAVHYFRTHPDQWAERLAVARAMGLNTVETYVPWNLHEPTPGRHDFDGLADVERFLERAAEAGLDAIVRPGPYICAEWENGGLPSWLEGPVRCGDSGYLAAVDHWFDVLVPRLAAHQVTRGGNVVMVQVENEYGSYGSDAAYLAHLRDGMVARGVDVPLFTSDGASALFLTGGVVPDVLATANFGSRAEEQFAELRAHRPHDPLFCMEFWCGWFDHWGDRHTTRDPADAAAALAEILGSGASVNIYMAHGGTNFGFWAGANADGDLHDGGYRPTTTSYDYDAPMDEAGRPTEKYWAFREVIGRYAPLPPPPATAPDPLAPRTVPMTKSVRLFDVLDVVGGTETSSPQVPSFEEVGQHQGFLLHRAALPGPRPALPLRVADLRDRAQLYVDGVERATFARKGLADRRGAEAVDVAGPADVELLVEAMGRINYGPLFGERKGVLGGVLHERQFLHGWRTTPIPLTHLPDLPWERGGAGYGPVFFGGTLDVEEPRDAYLSLAGWGKGVVWVNGFNLGRFWEVGPQVTLYLPRPVLRPGVNDVVVLELHPGDNDRSIAVAPGPHLG